MKDTTANFEENAMTEADRIKYETGFILATGVSILQLMHTRRR